MKDLGYASFSADPDVWMRPAERDDGSKYYEYVLLYLDDCLCVLKDPNNALMKISKYFPIKPSSLGPPRSTYAVRYPK